jgi:PBP1b-binding outer membrane lipoprotein LpoB
MKRWVVLSLLALSAVVVGCEEQSQPQSGSPTPGQTAQAAPIKDEDLPTEAEFDDEAEKDITSANYKTELDSLEKEISAAE